MLLHKFGLQSLNFDVFLIVDSGFLQNSLCFPESWRWEVCVLRSSKGITKQRGDLRIPLSDSGLQDRTMVAFKIYPLTSEMYWCWQKSKLLFFLCFKVFQLPECVFSTRTWFPINNRLVSTQYYTVESVYSRTRANLRETHVFAWKLFSWRYFSTITNHWSVISNHWFNYLLVTMILGVGMQ